LICPLSDIKHALSNGVKNNVGFKDKKEVNFIEEAHDYIGYNNGFISCSRSQRQSEQ
jgi:hypothetical protein